MDEKALNGTNVTVEHPLGKGKVVCSIQTGSTIYINRLGEHRPHRLLRCCRRFHPESANIFCMAAFRRPLGRARQ